MKRWVKENFGFLVFLLCFGFFRTAVADWNPIPSASMQPTLLEGDVVLVDRLAYDFKVPLTDVSLARLGEPRRGDVVTFTSPKDGVRLIKRLVGLPGDVVELRNELLLVNGVPAQYRIEKNSFRSVRAIERLGAREHAIQVLPTVQAMRSFGPVVVPRGSYFFLGDNRDDSADSRYIGFVPRSALIGRAHHLLGSADINADWMPRFDRFGKRID
jgi:signal peptidase I